MDACRSHITWRSGGLGDSTWTVNTPHQQYAKHRRPHQRLIRARRRRPRARDSGRTNQSLCRGSEDPTISESGIRSSSSLPSPLGNLPGTTVPHARHTRGSRVHVCPVCAGHRHRHRLACASRTVCHVTGRHLSHRVNQRPLELGILVARLGRLGIPKTSVFSFRLLHDIHAKLRTIILFVVAPMLDSISRLGEFYCYANTLSLISSIARSGLFTPQRMGPRCGSGEKIFGGQRHALV